MCVTSRRSFRSSGLATYVTFTWRWRCDVTRVTSWRSPSSKLTVYLICLHFIISLYDVTSLSSSGSVIVWPPHYHIQSLLSWINSHYHVIVSLSNDRAPLSGKEPYYQIEALIIILWALLSSSLIFIYRASLCDELPTCNKACLLCSEISRDWMEASYWKCRESVERE